MLRENASCGHKRQCSKNKEMALVDGRMHMEITDVGAMYA